MNSKSHLWLGSVLLMGVLVTLSFVSMNISIRTHSVAMLSPPMRSRYSLENLPFRVFHGQSLCDEGESYCEFPLELKLLFPPLFMLPPGALFYY